MTWESKYRVDNAHKEEKLFTWKECRTTYFHDVYLFQLVGLNMGAWGSVVVKALRYQSDGPGIDCRWCHWIFQ